jgi:hypothetical protein
MDIKRSGSQPSVKGPADWFTGTVRDLVFSNFNSAAFSLDCTSMALSESPFLMRGGSQGESKTAWSDV